MRFLRYALVLAVAGQFFCSTVSFAQQPYGRGGPYGQRAAYRHNYDVRWDDPAAAASPSDPMAPVADPAASGNGAAAPEEPKEEAKEEEEEKPNNEPCRLFQNQWLECHDIKVYGYVAQSFTWNTGNPTDRYNGPVTWMDRSNEYQLNQLWLTVEKTTEADPCSWDFGWRADALYGTDHRFVPGNGLDLTPGGVPQWNRDFRFYGLVLPQFYVEAKKGDTTIRAGRMVAPCGYFGVQTSNNFFAILPYTFQYGEPFTHLGVTASKTLNDNLTVMGGVVRGWDVVWDRDPRAQFMGLLSITGDCKDSLNYYVCVGDEPANSPAGAFRPRYLQTVTYQRPLNDCWTYVLQSDFGAQNGGVARDGRTAYWYGVNQYLYYKQNDCWSWGGNFEWFRDDGGSRVGGFLQPRPGFADGDRGLPVARSGYNGSFFRLMVGPRWTPHNNIMVRSAIAYDFYAGPVGVNGNLPYQDGRRREQLLLTTDVVFHF